LDLNTVFEPIPWEFNGKKCWVASGETKLYLFHTQKARWVIGRQMDDGSRCYAFLADDGNTQTPSECERDGAKWKSGGSAGRWDEEPRMRSTMIRASEDPFVRLRVQVEKEMSNYGLVEPKDLKALWKKVDKDGSNEIEVSEVLDCTHELVKSGIWPKWMSFQDALEQAFEATLEESDCDDHSLHQEEFHSLLLNMFWFCKLHEIFTQIDSSRDNAISMQEFQQGMARLGMQLSGQSLEREFRELDRDGGGTADFTEFCFWVRMKVTPEHNHAFDTDKQGATRMAKKQPAEATSGVVMKKKSCADFDKLEKKLKAMCTEESGKGVQKLWKRLDFNGNNLVSLAEIDKWVVETWPLLNHKPALMRAFKATTEAGGNRDGYVHKKDFKQLLMNLFYYNKLFWLFDQVDEEHDRRMDLKEFTWCLSMCGCKMSENKAAVEFHKVDANDGGEILFDEFCRYFTKKQCPPELMEFVADE
jgi:Ca2+-binding EF-hand superfamily protein